MKKIAIIMALLSFFIISCGSSIKEDKEIMTAIQNAAKNCKLDMRYAFVKNCGEITVLQNLIKRKTAEASTPTVALALNSKDEKVKVVACKLLYREIKDKMYRIAKNFKQKKSPITKAVAKKLIEGLKNLKSYVAFYATATTTHIAMLTDTQDKLYPVLEKHPIPQVRYEAYANMMVYGRMKAFEKMKELYKKHQKSDDKWILHHITTAPNRMYKATDGEKKIMGEWAKEAFKSDNPRVVLNAGYLMNQIGGELIDIVLAEIEKRGADGELEKPYPSFLKAYKFSCKSFLGSKPTGSPEQCKKLEELKAKFIQ